MAPKKCVDAVVSADGQFIRVSAHYSNDNGFGLLEPPYDCYYIHLPSATCVRGDFGKLEQEFYIKNPSDYEWNIITSYAEAMIEHNGKEYKIFADDSFIVKGE